MCTSKVPCGDAYLHNYNSEVLLQWKFYPSESWMPLKHKLVCLWSFPLSFYLFRLQTTLKCYWSTQEATLKSWLQLLSVSGWWSLLGTSLYISKLSSHPLHCSKVVLSGVIVCKLYGSFPFYVAWRFLFDFMRITGSCPQPDLRNLFQCHPLCQCPQWSHPLSW